MAANNNGTYIGNVGSDPTSRQAGQTTLTEFSLAVTRQGKDRDGNKVTDWFRAKCWGKTGELARDLIRKGTKVAVCGAINVEKWTNKDGVEQTTVTINADGFELLSPKQEPAGRQWQDAKPRDAEAGQFSDDDIPPF